MTVDFSNVQTVNMNGRLLHRSNPFVDRVLNSLSRKEDPRHDQFVFTTQKSGSELVVSQRSLPSVVIRKATRVTRKVARVLSRARGMLKSPVVPQASTEASS